MEFKWNLSTIVTANEKVDAPPMEGFNPDALEELLELKNKIKEATPF